MSSSSGSSARAIGSKALSAKITGEDKVPTIEYADSGMPIQTSEEDVIAGKVTTEQRAAERAATAAFYQGETDTEVQRRADSAYRRSIGLDPLPTETPFATALAEGKELQASDVYSPEYASLTDRATTEHVLALADELGIPDEQPTTEKEKAEAMKARKELVERLKAEGIDSGLAWSLAKQASYTKQEPDKFKKLYGVDAGSSLKAYESERIMDELKGLKADLSHKAGKIGGQFQDIQEKYKDLGFYERGRGLVSAPISMGMEPGVRSP